MTLLCSGYDVAMTLLCSAASPVPSYSQHWTWQPGHQETSTSLVYQSLQCWHTRGKSSWICLANSSFVRKGLPYILCWLCRRLLLLARHNVSSIEMFHCNCFDATVANTVAIACSSNTVAWDGCTKLQKPDMRWWVQRTHVRLAATCESRSTCKITSTWVPCKNLCLVTWLLLDLKVASIFSTDPGNNLKRIDINVSYQREPCYQAGTLGKSKSRLTCSK